MELQQNLRGFEPVQQRSRVRPDPEAAVGPLLSEFVQLHDFDTDYVVAALPGDHLSTRTVSFPFRERRKLAQAIPFAIEEELPFDLDEVVIDWTIIGLKP